MNLYPSHCMGDHAYGTVANHLAALLRNEQQRLKAAPPTELIARMPRPVNGGRFTKDEFQVDFENRTLTCPAGYQCQMTRWEIRDQERGWAFQYPAPVCNACADKPRCVSDKAKDKGRSVFLVPHKERLIRLHLRRREELDFVALLSQRPMIERVISGFAQCGGKEAHRMGTGNVSFDGTLSAVAYNLRTLGAVLKRKPELAQALQAQAARTDRVATRKTGPTAQPAPWRNAA
jgi:hypothetical protein